MDQIHCITKMDQFPDAVVAFGFPGIRQRTPHGGAPRSHHQAPAVFDRPPAASILVITLTLMHPKD